MIALLTGGNSSERDVSLATAKTIADALEKLERPFQVIDVRDADWLSQTLTLQPEVVIIGLHGKFGEGGELQAILEENHLSFTGSPSFAARLLFNKSLTKEKLALHGIRVPAEYRRTDLTAASLPVVVKPNSEGSSVGITIVRKMEELEPAFQKAQALDSTVLIEEYIEGTELTCAVTDVYGKIQALPLVEIRPANEFFDYEAKYTVGRCEEICPAPQPALLTKTIQEQSEEIYRILDIRQYCRIDWMLQGSTPYFLEVNTIPGMTPTSLINKELQAAGILFEEFIAQLVEKAR